MPHYEANAADISNDRSILLFLFSCCTGQLANLDNLSVYPNKISSWNVSHLIFSFFYFPLIYAAKAVLLTCANRKVLAQLSLLLCIFIIPLYLIGMFRSQGVDISNYRRVYENLENSTIVDPGYNFLMYVGNSIGLELEGFLLAIGLLNLFLIFKVCRFLKVNFGIVLAILALHLTVVRDFAQLRVGLAINIALYGFILKGRSKYLLYIVAGSIHFTALVIVGFFMTQKTMMISRSIIKVLPFIGVVVLGSSLSLLSSIDPRMELYMSWDRENYGQPVSNYSQLLFVLFLIISSITYRGEYQNLYMLSFIFAATVFCSFASVSIFSFRLTNVAISLYPYFAAAFLRSRENSLKKKALFIASLLFLLSLRSSNDAILGAIVTGFE